MKLIKKSEKLLLKKIKTMEEEEELDLQQSDDTDEVPSWDEELLPPNLEIPEPNYIPLRDNPLVQSVGNTGWQISEIWKEIRLDSF